MQPAELIERFRAADDPTATARLPSDRELCAVWNGLTEDAGGPLSEAVSDELECRGLDL